MIQHHHGSNMMTKASLAKLLMRTNKSDLGIEYLAFE